MVVLKPEILTVIIYNKIYLAKQTDEVKETTGVVTTDKGVTVEIKGATDPEMNTADSTTKVTTQIAQNTQHTTTTERVESKVGESEQHIVVPSYNAGHSGMFN